MGSCRARVLGRRARCFLPAVGRARSLSLHDRARLSTRRDRLWLIGAGIALMLCCTAVPSPVLDAQGSSQETLVPGHEPAWIPVHPEHSTPATSPLPGILTASSGVRGSVVTPAQAGQIVNALWTLRSNAFTSHSAPLMAEFEAGPALESDEVTCGCTQRGVRGPMLSDTLLVPRQPRYPATFLAEVNTTLEDAPYVQTLIVERTSSSTPWKVVSDPGDTVTYTLVTAKTDGQGYDVAPRPPASASRLPSELAAYWQAWRTFGHVPPGHTLLDAGPYTTGAQSILGTETQGAYDSYNGLNGYYVERASARSWSFGTATGAITCGVVWDQDIWTSPSGVYQDPQQENWGPTVPPGAYRMDATTDIAQPCFIQRPHQPTSVVDGLLDPDTEQALSPIAPSPASPPSQA